MFLEQCTSLQESVEGYSQTSSLDTRQLSLLSGIDTLAKSLENVQQMDGSQDCQCGKGMSECLIHPSTPEAWTLFMRDSLAKTLALLESKQVYLREPDQVFTEKSCVSLAWYDQSNSSWKTYQQSLVTDWEPYSETWPRWGMTQGGCAFAHPMSGLTITETDGSVWLGTPTAAMSERSPEFAKGRKPSPAEAARLFPTPTASTGGANHASAAVNKKGHGINLAGAIQMWPTPTAHNAKETNAPSESNRNTPTLAAQAGGQLNPNWVGWLMGFPIGWANSKDTETHKSRCKQQLPTDCLEGAE